MTDHDVKRLSIELEVALLHELQGNYLQLNQSLFKRRLKPAGLTLSVAEGRLGRWVADTRTIEIGRTFVLSAPWGAVIEVLKHEMAHQYVSEVIGARDESAHGPAFRELCERLGIDQAAAGMPRTYAASGEEARVLERIAKLLALAESQNQHEAEAAMSAAQRLMLKYNLESVASRARLPYSFRHLGKPTGRVSEAERMLGTILGKHFFVEVIWVPVYRPLEGMRGSVLEVCGTDANLEMAAYVHSFLSHTSERLWSEHKKANRIKRDRERRTFLAGVMVGFYEKLNESRKTSQQEGLVWAGDADLEGYYRKRHPNIQHVRYTGTRRTEAHAHGRAAGRNIVLHKPVGSGPSGSVKLLGR